MDRVRHHHAGEDRLDRLRDQGLERVALQGHPHVGHRHDRRGVAGGDDADPAGADEAADRLDTDRRPRSVPADALHLAVLDDVDAAGVGAAGVAPGDRVVPGGAGPALQGAAEHRVAEVAADLQGWAEVLARFLGQPHVVDAVEPVGVDVPLEALNVVDVVREHQHAALREHHVVVQFLRQALPELEGVLVEGRALVVEVVGADDRGVAAGIAASDPALLQHGDVGDAVDGREVVGRRQAVAAAADDDDVVGRFRLRIPPLTAPALVAPERFREQRCEGEAAHR